jgi:hypothetical protein
LRSQEAKDCLDNAILSGGNAILVCGAGGSVMCCTATSSGMDCNELSSQGRGGITHLPLPNFPTGRSR